ncbi:HigA family addiction module antitoxin [Roseococcus sp. YIM B11640]|uniref:HigA family addiction module antitoxin n=1 Tax=Roseococcus sp. YIM B11640 TaxID=3133973 RepID=UPI003C7E28AC
MPLDITRYPIQEAEQFQLLAEAYAAGTPEGIDRAIRLVSRARGLTPTCAQPQEPRKAEPALPKPPYRTTASPGEVLARSFMAPMKLSAKRLAAELGVSRSRIGEILQGTRGISAETAILFARRFGTRPEFWLRLQIRHDLARAYKSI